MLYPDTELGRLQHQTDQAYTLEKVLQARYPDTYVGLDFEYPEGGGRGRRDALFLFRRDGRKLLAAHVDRPDFVARDVRYTKWDLARLQDRWMAKFKPFDVMEGGGAYLGRQVVEFTMRMPKPEFDAIAATQGWTIPDTLSLQFPDGPDNAPVPTALARLIRIFPRDDRLSSIRRLAHTSGGIVLRDGCFRVVSGPGGRGGLAYFSRGTTLALDDAGYLTLGGSGSPTRGRVGDRFTWNVAGPPQPRAPMLDALRRACGNDEIFYVLDAHAFGGRPVRGG